MGKMKLYELAKELNLTSKELLNKASELGISVKSHLSSLEDADIEKLRKNVANKTENKSSKKEKNKETKKEAQSIKNDKSAPVIIRREVIIEEEKKKEKKAEVKENKNPFVKRNDKKDYNIVYRNRP